MRKYRIYITFNTTQLAVAVVSQLAVVALILRLSIPLNSISVWCFPKLNV